MRGGSARARSARDRSRGPRSVVANSSRGDALVDEATGRATSSAGCTNSSWPWGVTYEVRQLLPAETG